MCEALTPGLLFPLFCGDRERDDQKIRIRRKTSVLFPRWKLGGIIQGQLVGDGFAAAPA